jgi:DNA polymerase III delta prime subunit
MLDSAFDSHSPKKLEDIVGNSETWASLWTSIKHNKSSHIILVGPPGCGKSVFLRLVFQEFQVLRVDCTANSGLRDVRDTIRMFARGSGSPNGNLRWIHFEHADKLTSDTQAFLRRMLETTHSTTRIVFECEDAGAITEPILSRSNIVSVNAPERTEMLYELQRRTNFSMDAGDIAKIVDTSYGNLRTALLNAFALQYCGKSPNVGKGYDELLEILRLRPASKDLHEWVKWAIDAETSVRAAGLDLRDVLRLGWPSHPAIANTCAQWSRLGGTSPRTLFFDCIATLLR